jgi:DnaK suppressor protein
MKEKELNFFKDLLTRWLDELLHQADDTVEGLLEIEEHLPDPLDRASFESNRSTALRIRDRESMLIRKIKNSLEDIQNGEYGICEDCGREISINRLKVRPVARRCIHCKTKQENLEKIMGL